LKVANAQLAMAPTVRRRWRTRHFSANRAWPYDRRISLAAKFVWFGLACSFDDVRTDDSGFRNVQSKARMDCRMAAWMVAAQAGDRAAYETLVASNEKV